MTEKTTLSQASAGQPGRAEEIGEAPTAAADPAAALRRSIDLRRRAEDELSEAGRTRREALAAAEAVLAETHEVVEVVRTQARAEAAETVQEARERAAGIVVRARAEADQIAQAAQADAEARLDAARAEGEVILSESETEAAATLADARAGAEQLLDEGRLALADERREAVEQAAALDERLRRDASDAVAADLVAVRAAFVAFGLEIAHVEETIDNLASTLDAVRGGQTTTRGGEVAPSTAVAFGGGLSIAQAAAKFVEESGSAVSSPADTSPTGTAREAHVPDAGRSHDERLQGDVLDESAVLDMLEMLGESGQGAFDPSESFTLSEPVEEPAGQQVEAPVDDLPDDLPEEPAEEPADAESSVVRAAGSARTDEVRPLGWLFRSPS